MKQLLKNNTKKLQNEIISKMFGKYFIVGITGFIVDSIVLNYLKFQVFKGEGDVILGIVSTAKLISGAVGISVSFYLNRNWTFESIGKHWAPQSLKMLLSFLLSIVLGAIFITIYIEIIEWQTIIDFGNMVPTLANACTSGTLLLLNFFIYKFFVFK